MKKKLLIPLILLVLVLVGYTLFFISGEMAQRRLEEEHARLLAEYPIAYRDEIEQYAKEFSLDPYLVLSIMRCESSFRPEAVSSVGAIGLMQIMPDTGTWIAHKLDMDDVYEESMLYEPSTNIRFGCWFMRFLTNRFDGERTHIIAAYNAGHGSVEGWLEDPKYSENGKLTSIPFPETERYLDKITTAYAQYRNLYPDLFTDASIVTQG